MNQPSVSIIVPVYNVGPYVEDCIGSVMRQTYDGKMECIVVDDCGTDDSMAIVERLVAKYSGPITFKILHHTHNRGLSAARNTGMDAATGNYLFFLDSDDELTDDCIEKLMVVAREDDKIEIVQGNARKKPERVPDSLIKEMLIPHPLDNKSVRSCYFRYHQLNNSAWNKLIKRSFILHHNLLFKEGIIYEDVLWTFFMLKHAVNVCFVSDITYYYTIRSNSIMNGTDSNISVLNYCMLYHTILTDLTPTYEIEELSYYTKEFIKQYLKNPHEYKNLFRLFWNKSWRLKCYFCCKLLSVAYISNYKLGRGAVAILRKIKKII